MSKIRIANAPCSWGVLEFESTAKANTFDRVLDEMAAAGYIGTELGDWGFMPTDPTALKSELAKRKLEMIGAFVPVYLSDAKTHAAGVEAAIKTAKLLKAVAAKPFIVLSDDNCHDKGRAERAGRIRPQDGLSKEAWKVFAEGADRVAAAVHDATGVRTVFHHHCGGYVETPAEVDTLLELTSKKLLGLCLDTGHYMFGGGDPKEALSRYGDRIWHVHFKDCHPGIASEARSRGFDYLTSVKKGVFCELGKGAVSFGGIVAALKERRYDGWVVVEQDVLPGMGSPLESAKRNRAFIMELGL